MTTWQRLRTSGDAQGGTTATVANLTVHGVVYGLHDGLLRDLGVSRSSAATT